MSYTIYTKGITSNFFDKDGYKIGFWCYYLRTENTTELKCKVVKSEDTRSAMRDTQAHNRNYRPS